VGLNSRVLRARPELGIGSCTKTFIAKVFFLVNGKGNLSLEPVPFSASCPGETCYDQELLNYSADGIVEVLRRKHNRTSISP
jgi:hypothetical protein